MSKYQDIIEHVFKKNHIEGSERVAFDREELVQACDDLNIPRIRNIGDIPYSFRFRTELPEAITRHAPEESEWIILGTGAAKYEFRLASPGKIAPSAHRQKIKIPDATPEIVKLYAAGTDEQALLTKVRYNRLVDIFMGLTCYSIQNHLRTTVVDVGQIEVDEIYLGVNKKGAHFVIPCQAKSPGDRFGIVQVMQDIELCRQKYPNAICRPLALQFLSDTDVAILELEVSERSGRFQLSVADERHYTLVHQGDISPQEIKTMNAMQ